MSNTKLTVQQKQLLKTLREMQADIVICHFPDIRVCVAIKRQGEKMGEFSVSICADTETKYRKKVGELLVRERMDYGQSLPVELGEFSVSIWDNCTETDKERLEMVAENIALTLTR